MINLKKIADSIGIEFIGSDIEISGLNNLKDAQEGELAFIDHAKYTKDLENTKASAVIVSSSMKEKVPTHVIALVDEEVNLKLAYASELFAPLAFEVDGKEPVIGEGSIIAPTAFISTGATIGKNTTIMPGAVIGNNAKVGNNCIVYPNVTIYRDCVIGDRCIIHASTVIGSDGFGFAHTKLGEHVKIFQNGNVVLESDVEIGSNTSIDRAVFKTTLVKKGVKIDNLVQIGHNCVIGEHSIIVSQAGIAGTTTLGRNVVLGGQSATSGHLDIAPFSTFAARAGVTKSIKEPHKTYAGFPLMEHKPWMKLQAKIAKLAK
ncbi:MAG: UDP-3-O-(3-hydroxymyristoyl)glucosamine N-acyltransferase [Helicobacteraceae bacterium]|nr:UDP-3-O-(3-hydroxymyristoyl)glucosamine N-acyltransferase [Helicobacteraceae bacterium]